MDTDPQIAADIANDISALIDTVFNNMKQERALAAFELVKQEYYEAEKNVISMQDSLQELGNNISVSLRSGGGSIAHIGQAIAQNGGEFIALTKYLDHETGRLTELRQRYQEARVESVQELPHKFIVDQAYPAEKKAYPKRSVIVMVSTASAFLFTLILLIIIDSLQERVAVIKED
jgi:formyltetrahydrofolate hydrolase